MKTFEARHLSLLRKWPQFPLWHALGEVTPEVIRLLEVMQGDMTRADLMARLGLKAEKHFREHYLQTAASDGLIEMTRPDAPQSRLQKYRHRGKGNAALAAARAKEKP